MDLVEPDKNEVEKTETRRVTDVRPNNQPAGIGWLRTLSMILVAIILVVLIVLFARWVYHKAHHSANLTKPATSQQKTGTTTSPSTEQGQSTGGTSSSNSSNSSNSSSASPTNAQASSGSTANQLPNNGPGNVAAVFVGASLAAASLHYAVTSRRAKA